MGNSVSCLSPTVPGSVVKVIALHGSVQEFERPLKAGELMMDNHQHFVCHSTALEAARRISALSADDELELGHVYFLLPMHKLHSSLSPSEKASLAFKADSALQKSASNSRRLARILPVLGDLRQRKIATTGGEDESNGEIKCVKEPAEANDIGGLKLQVNDAGDLGQLATLNLRNSKYWKPVLETIIESPRNITRRITSANLHQHECARNITRRINSANLHQRKSSAIVCA